MSCTSLNYPRALASPRRHRKVHHLVNFAGYKGIQNIGYPLFKPMSFSSVITSWAVTHPYHSLAVVLFLCFAGLTAVRDSKRNSGRLPYPPGPKGYPIIGSLLEAPTGKTWLTYAEWGKTYGERRHTPSL